MIEALSLAVVAGGILAAAGVAVLAGLRTGLAVLLDFLLAAGLLRLSSSLEWTAIGSIALIVAIRQVISRGLRAGGPPQPTSA